MTRLLFWKSTPRQMRHGRTARVANVTPGCSTMSGRMNVAGAAQFAHQSRTPCRGSDSGMHHREVANTEILGPLSRIAALAIVNLNNLHHRERSSAANRIDAIRWTWVAFRIGPELLHEACDSSRFALLHD